MKMNRRNAIATVGALLGTTVIREELFAAYKLNGGTAIKMNDLFSAKDIQLLDEIADTIIPQTDTPGAKAAKVGEFMALMITDCYTARDKNVFIKGIKQVDEEANILFSAPFISCNPQQRKELLIKLDSAQKQHQRVRKSGQPVHYFRLMKELTLLGYFTSEIGATQQLRYEEVPGRYDACVLYKKGDSVYLNP